MIDFEIRILNAEFLGTDGRAHTFFLPRLTHKTYTPVVPRSVAGTSTGASRGALALRGPATERGGKLFSLNWLRGLTGPSDPRGSNGSRGLRGPIGSRDS